MSGGIAQLVAVGAQDVHLVGNPQVSFFRSAYKRHTNFSTITERQVIQGNPAPGGMSTVRFERKGDLLSYAYFTVGNGTNVEKFTASDWMNLITKVELLIGGQVIDEQTSEFSELIAVDTLGNSLSKSCAGSHHAGHGCESYFYPLRFSCFENWQSALPLVALQYHDVELRITWGKDIDAKKVECMAHFICLDDDERRLFASKPIDMLIYQVQKALGSGGKNIELNFNHPVKFIAMRAHDELVDEHFITDSNRAKIQINGTDITDYKTVVPNFTSVQSYYHSPWSVGNEAAYFLYSFGLDTNRIQPTGSLNFSRLDSARVMSEDGIIDGNIYAVNYNILRIQNGMGGLAYSN